MPALMPFAIPQPQPLPVTALARHYAEVRAATLTLVAPLSEADCQAQSMDGASPAKWHLAHTTWFFETFVLERFEPDFRPHHPAFRVLFNSYYQGVGEQAARPQRGLITRPGLAEVKAYRAEVDMRVLRLLQGDAAPAMLQLVALGLQHEQQHQELILTDVLHLFSANPLAPVYRSGRWPAWRRSAWTGWPTRVASSRRDMRVRNFHSTTKALGTRPGCSRTRWRTGS